MILTFTHLFSLPSLRLAPTLIRSLGQLRQGLLCATICVWTGLGVSAQAQTMTTAGQFAVSPSGAATYSIPIQVPPGAGGMQPQLALSYNSQAGNGLLGVGWNLSGLSAITRCPRTMAQDGVRGGVNYDSNDRFCLDGQRLVLVAGTYGAAGSEYRTELENFARITYDGAGFTVQSKGGLTSYYGGDKARNEVPLSGYVYSWALNKLTDAVGNYMKISYSTSGGVVHVSQIEYAGNDYKSEYPTNKVNFNYETRPDAIPFYHRTGGPFYPQVRLIGIDIYSDIGFVKSYNIGYEVIPDAVNFNRSFMNSIKECAGIYDCFPSLIFNYSNFSGMTVPTFSWSGHRLFSGGDWGNQHWFAKDVNEDGLADLINIFNDAGSTSVDVYIRTLEGFQWQQWEKRVGGNPDNQRWFVQDVNGDGLPDLVSIFNDSGSMSAEVHVNKGGSFQLQPWETKAGGNPDSHQWFIHDFNGDGLPDLMNIFNDAGYVSVDVHINNGLGFQMQRWESKSGNYSDSQHWYVQDVNGDGLLDLISIFNDSGYMSADVHINTGVAFQVQHWVNKEGEYSDAQRWIVQDINGDGLADLVVIFKDQMHSSVDVYLNTGDRYNNGLGILSKQRTLALGIINTDPGDWILQDVNGDGLPDLVNIINSASRSEIHYNTGVGFTDSMMVPLLYSNSQNVRWFFQDATGDEFLDLIGIYQELTGAIHVEIGVNKNVPRMISSISDNSKNLVTVEYQKISNGISEGGRVSYPKLKLASPPNTVMSVSTPSATGNVNTKKYTYGGLKAELGTGRGILGFGWMNAREEATGIESYTEYRQDWPYTGLASLNETRLAGAGAGGLLKRTQISYGCKTGSGADCQPVPANCNLAANVATCTGISGARVFPYASSVTEQSWDLNGTAMPSITTNTQYDKSRNDALYWGDASQVLVTTSSGASTSTKQVQNEYYPANTSNGKWISGRLKRASVTSTVTAP